MPNRNLDRSDFLLNGEEPKTQREWNLLFAYRLRQVEKRLDALYRAVFVIGGGILVGVVVYLLTVVIANSGSPGK